MTLDKLLDGLPLVISQAGNMSHDNDPLGEERVLLIRILGTVFTITAIFERPNQ